MIDDITDKNTTEFQLKETEEKFRVLTEGSLVGVYMIQDLKFKYVNSTFCKISGYDDTELIDQKGPFDLIHPDDAEKLQELRERWLDNDLNTFEVEFRGLRKNGEMIHVQAFGSRIDYDNQPAIIGVLIDESDQHKAVENFRMSVESYKALFDSIGDAIYIQDKDGNFVEVNDGAAKMYGYDKGYFLGKNPSFLAAPGKVDMDKTFEYFEKALEGEQQRFEWWGKKKNGEVFPKEVTLNPGLYFGEKVVIAIARNINEQYQREKDLRRNEELFRQLFKNAPVGIAMLDEHKEIRMVNHGFEEVFGFEEAEIIGLDIDKVIVPEGKEEEAAELSNSHKAFEVSSQRKKKDGSLVDVLIYGVPVKVDDKTIAIYGIYVDITDRKKAEEKVKKSLKEKEVLLAEIHHRVKNNLAVITGLLELQGQNTTNLNAQKALKDSQLRINSMALIHEKLYQSENLSQIEFNIYIEELTNVISRSHTTEEKQINFEISADPVTLTITQAIPCGLLLNEIVTNSLKHAFPDQNKGTIFIRFKKENGKLRFEIEDDGIGLPDDFENIKFNSLGMTLINTLSKQLDAEMQIQSNDGTKYSFLFDYDQVEFE